MMYYNFEKHKEFLYLDLFVYLIPISIILGNLIINIVSAACIFIYFLLIYKRKIIYNNYKNYFFVLYSITAFLLLNLIFSKNKFKNVFSSILGHTFDSKGGVYSFGPLDDAFLSIFEVRMLPRAS